MELLIGKGGISRNRQQIPIKSDSVGWFAMCGLPSDAELQASAQAGDEETGVVEVRIPPGGLLMGDFLVSRADTTVPVYDDSSATRGVLPLPMLRRGAARVTGTVHNDKGKPVEKRPGHGSGHRHRWSHAGEWIVRARRTSFGNANSRGARDRLRAQTRHGRPRA
jgi:hypothetical protein